MYLAYLSQKGSPFIFVSSVTSTSGNRAVITGINYYTYNFELSQYFKAYLVLIAWSGKGLY